MKKVGGYGDIQINQCNGKTDSSIHQHSVFCVMTSILCTWIWIGKIQDLFGYLQITDYFNK